MPSSNRWRQRIVWLCIPFAVLSAGTFLVARALAFAPTADPDVTIVAVSPDILHADVRPFGLNLGNHTTYDAALLLRNVIPNPGFEAGELAQLGVITGAPTVTRVQVANWISPYGRNLIRQRGQPPGFWDGADYSIALGAARGRIGQVISFTHEQDLFTFYLDGDGPQPAAGDLLQVRRVWPGVIVGRPTTTTQAADPTQARPGSPGAQALKLLPPTAEEFLSFRFYLDSYGRDGDPEAGQLLVADGAWELSFWAKAERPTDTLRIKWWRTEVTEPVFFQTVLTPTAEWAFYRWSIAIPIGADRPISATRHTPLGLEFWLKANSAPIWIDDIALERAGQTNPTVFSDRVVALLAGLRPGVLRDWGHQLGSSLDNQLAPAWARRTTGWEPVHTTPRFFHYSLHDFLELAAYVGSEPWYVIPPTFDNADMADLAAYLAAPVSSGHPYALRRAALGQEEPWTAVFPLIHLEFGNELWGSGYEDDPFWGATVHGGQRAAQLAGERLAALRNSPWFTADRFNLLIGSQAFYLPTTVAIERWSNAHDVLALAPYYGRRVDAGATITALLTAAYANPRQDVTDGSVALAHTVTLTAGNNTRLAVYELNFHTTRGELSPATRNDLTAGAAGGLALPLHMLSYLQAFGVRRQAAFELAQFSTPVAGTAAQAIRQQREWRDRLTGDPAVGERAPEALEFVRLWGLRRDLEATGRARPGWLALALVNQALVGDLVVTEQSGYNPTWVQPPGNDIVEAIDVPVIQSFALRSAAQNSLILFNLDLTTPQRVALVLPHMPSGEVTRLELTAPEPISSNEAVAAVFPTTSTITLLPTTTLTLPPFSLTVLLWPGDPALRITTHAAAGSAEREPIGALIACAAALAALSLAAWGSALDRRPQPLSPAP